MDLLVHLSRREGLARALPQAMAAGRPVVACDCDGAAEVCIDDQTGYLVRPGDGAALLDRLLLLAGNPSLRARLGAAGCEFVRDRFPVEKMVESLRELYEKLGAKPPG
jgi:glycosyltransferase involved in cell wall biosynthesis